MYKIQHQHGGVGDAITGKCQNIVLALGGQQLFYAVDFIGGQQLGMVFIQTQLAADLAGNGFTVDVYKRQHGIRAALQDERSRITFVLPGESRRYPKEEFFYFSAFPMEGRAERCV